MKCYTYILFVTFGLVSSTEYEENKWECMDAKCSEAISFAEVKIDYRVPDHDKKLKLKRGEKLQILGKPINNDLYLVKAINNNQMGFVAKRFFQETNKAKTPEVIVTESQVDLTKPPIKNIDKSLFYRKPAGGIGTPSFDINSGEIDLNETDQINKTIPQQPINSLEIGVNDTVESEVVEQQISNDIQSLDLDSKPVESTPLVENDATPILGATDSENKTSEPTHFKTELPSNPIIDATVIATPPIETKTEYDSAEIISEENLTTPFPSAVDQTKYDAYTASPLPTAQDSSKETHDDLKTTSVTQNEDNETISPLAQTELAPPEHQTGQDLSDNNTQPVKTTEFVTSTQESDNQATPSPSIALEAQQNATVVPPQESLDSSQNEISESNGIETDKSGEQATQSPSSVLIAQEDVTEPPSVNEPLIESLNSSQNEAGVLDTPTQNYEDDKATLTPSAPYQHEVPTVVPEELKEDFINNTLEPEELQEDREKPIELDQDLNETDTAEESEVESKHQQEIPKTESQTYQYDPYKFVSPESYTPPESNILQQVPYSNIPQQVPESNIPQQVPEQTTPQQVSSIEPVLEETSVAPAIEESVHEENSDTIEEESESWWYSPISAITNSFSELLEKSPSQNISDIEIETEIHNEEEPTPVKVEEIIPTASFIENVSPELPKYEEEPPSGATNLMVQLDQLHRQLLISEKERHILEERINSNTDSSRHFFDENTTYKNQILQLQEEVDNMKLAKTQAQINEQEVTKKCVILQKEYSEWQQTINEFKQKIYSLKEETKNLKKDIKQSETENSSLKDQVEAKNEEIKKLIIQIKRSNRELLQHEATIENGLASVRQYEARINKLENTIVKEQEVNQSLQDEIRNLTLEIENLTIEKELAESELQRAQGLKANQSLDEWLEAKEIRTSLIAAENDIEQLKAQVEKLEDDKVISEAHESSLSQEILKIKEQLDIAEKEKIEALTKLEVLSDYFQQKESQLQEELGSKEAFYLQKQNEGDTIYTKFIALEEENKSFKNQIETLKKEIVDQEASYKKLVTTAEEKAYENWVSLRQAERRLKEAQSEAAQLRNKLTVRDNNETDDKHKIAENGDGPFGSTMSPPFMMFQDFMPPPPLLSSGSRPPPLGRISSPPLLDFTPPPPLKLDADIFVPLAMPPPLPLKPSPRNRIKKDSQSSNSDNMDHSQKNNR